MKRIQKTLFVLTVALLTFSASYAQEKSPLKLAAGLNYGTDIEELGSNVGVEFGLTSKIDLAPNFTYFFTPSGLTAYSINADGKYNFTESDTKFYGLLGLSVAVVSIDFAGISISDNEFGINIGAGVTHALSSKIGLNGQLRYNTPFEQLEIMAGVLISLK